MPEVSQADLWSELPAVGEVRTKSKLSFLWRENEEFRQGEAQVVTELIPSWIEELKSSYEDDAWAGVASS